jgi:Zn-dependent protease
MSLELLDGPSLKLELFGVPVGLHWSFPGVGLGVGVPIGLLAAIVVAPLALTLFAWSLAAVALLVVVHEAGHALAARLLSIRVHAVLFAAGGGCCLADDAASPAHDAAYSVAGLAAQGLVLAATTTSLLGGPASPAPLGHGAAVFTGVNLLLIVANAWPRQGTDGHRIGAALARHRALRRPA